jgi:hypothetical protein
VAVAVFLFFVLLGHKGEEADDDDDDDEEADDAEEADDDDDLVPVVLCEACLGARINVLTIASTSWREVNSI